MRNSLIRIFSLVVIICLLAVGIGGFASLTSEAPHRLQRVDSAFRRNDSLIVIVPGA